MHRKNCIFLSLSPFFFEYHIGQTLNFFREKLLPLAKSIIKFNAHNNAEIQACDVALELDHLDLLVENLDENNYLKVCQYLASTADYT